MNRFRTPALIALWVQVVAVFGLCVFALWDGQFSWSAWMSGAEAFLAGLALVWWTQLFALVTQNRGVPTTNGTWRALAAVYPMLTAVRAALWGLTLLGILAGMAPEANSVALTALMTIWGGAIFASNAINAGILRLASGPDEAVLHNRTRLAEWLNTSAALSLGMAVLNVVPIKGFSDSPELASQLAYGVGGLLDVLATVLAFFALRAMGIGGQEEKESKTS